MDKYIDRDKLAEFARHSTIGIDANDIMRFPTADVVAVVRCEDCIHADVGEKDVWCEVYESYKEKDGFCDDGKRRETE